MCSRCHDVLLLLCALLSCGCQSPALRVCADPNNLPFSNERGQGFENRIAELLAGEMGRHLQTTWWVERKNFIRNTIDAGRCEVLVGIPSNFPGVLTTRPYYRSSYAFVYRKGIGPDISSLDDPRLESLRIGVHAIGDDYAPPAQALARRGIVRNVAAYSMFGGYTEPDPPARIIGAVARGDIDIALVWGPLAGYFARRQAVPLSVTPIAAGMASSVPLTYDISMGVRKGDRRLRDRIQAALDRKHDEIQRILDEYGVPRAKED